MEKTRKEEWSEAVVWLVQDKSRIENHRPKFVHDTSLAGRFGTRRVLLDHTARPWKPEEALDRIANLMSRAFRPDVDFLVPVGSPLLIGLALMYAGTMADRQGHESLQILLWNARMRDGAGDYELVRIPLDRLADIA